MGFSPGWAPFLGLCFLDILPSDVLLAAGQVPEDLELRKRLDALPNKLGMGCDCTYFEDAQSQIQKRAANH